MFCREVYNLIFVCRRYLALMDSALKAFNALIVVNLILYPLFAYFWFVFPIR